MDKYWTTSGTTINTSWKSTSTYGDDFTINYIIKK
jgi:hypothetical protein